VPRIHDYLTVRLIATGDLRANLTSSSTPSSAVNTHVMHSEVPCGSGGAAIRIAREGGRTFSIDVD